MKNYSNFTAVELALDDDFIHWVESDQKDEELEKQWNTWLMQHPEKVDVVNEAKSIIKAVTNDKQYLLTDSKHQELWTRIETSVSQESKVNHFSSFFAYGLAASLLIFILSGVAIYKLDLLVFKNTTVAEDSSWGNDQLLQYNNESNQVHSILLEDGSVVALQPHSALKYPGTFSGDHREVYLKGEAFFEVARNPEKPFSVYANDIVTQVLGTSFNVRAFDKEKDVVVAVKTGKVSVFTKEGEKRKNKITQNRVGTLLTPNQQVVFSKVQRRMIKSLVKEPVPLKTVELKDNFHFKDTPIKEVFKRIENTYGVEINFDEEAMSDCFLTTSLDKVPFYDKLRLICKGINAKYELLDAHIIITGKGCN